MQSPDHLITEVTIATMDPDQDGYGLIENGTVALSNGTIAWIGSAPDCPEKFANVKQTGFNGRLLTPALIDCHSHIVHGGNRALEFEMRLNGKSYQEISKSGGGIMSTVTATRDSTDAQLLETALLRVDDLIAQGVATLEIKSGYGLDTETELKMLRIARKIATLRPITIITSFLGAHAVPAGMSADSYIDDICIPTLELAHAQGLVDAVDGFCESIAFDTNQIARVFTKARALGLPVKLHAEQLTHSRGTALAASFGAISADHLEYATDADAELMAKSGTVAVLLPGAFYTLQEDQAPPITSFRAHNVPMALATDWNPGSSPLGSILLTMNMGCTLFHLTPQEALSGVTRNAAQALGLADRGVLRPGARADLAIWDVKTPAELSYRIGSNPLHTRIYAGKLSDD
ncbi:MAG: imidazolonepropionase [Paracoccaceae bacterium]